MEDFSKSLSDMKVHELIKYTADDWKNFFAWKIDGN